MLADRLSNYKLVLGLNIVLCAAFHSALISFPIIHTIDSSVGSYNPDFYCPEIGRNFTLQTCFNESLIQDQIQSVHVR